MIEIEGDLFLQQCDAICITTNGFVNSRGENVMGAGIAGHAKRRWPFLPGRLGRLIREYGHQVHNMTHGMEFTPEQTPPYAIVSFPTKWCVITNLDDLLPRFQREYAGQGQLRLPGWMGKSDLELIRRSTLQLVRLTQMQGWEKVCLTRPGCGMGGLNWEEEVRPAIADLLNDRFYIINLR